MQSPGEVAMFEFFVFTVVLFCFWAFASHLSRGAADRSAKHWSPFGNVELKTQNIATKRPNKEETWFC